MRSFFVFAFCVLCFVLAHAQSTVRGAVLDVDLQPIEFANVLLLNRTDSSLVAGMLSETDGTFALTEVPTDLYLVSIQFLGYETIYQEVEVTAPGQIINLEPITLATTAAHLNEIVVTAEKPLFEQHIDRLVVNVQSSVTSTGANALEVLGRSPGVRIDGINSEIAMNGSSGVIVQINGKRTRMEGDALLQFLRAMPANNIEKIELISTPPASYDAEGTAGIINIVLVTNFEEGINGNYSINGAYGERPKYGGAANVNLRRGRLNVFTDLSLNNSYLQEDVTITKQIAAPEGLLSTDTYSNRPAFRGFRRGRLGADFEVTPQTTVGVLLSGHQSRWDLDALTETTVKLDGTPFESSTLRSQEENDWNHWMGNVNLRHTFADNGKLSFDYDHLDYFNTNPTDYLDRLTSFENQSLTERDFISRKENPITFNVLKLDYSRSLAENWNVETGVKTTMSDFTNDNLLGDIVGGEVVPIERFTNVVNMSEKVHAAYVSTDYQLSEKTSFKAGVRYEYTDVELDDTFEVIAQRNYGRLFPSAFFSHNINDNNSFQVAYSERIRRPSLNVLAPAFFFFSPNVVTAGNPKIRETITQQLRLTYRYKSVIFNVLLSDDDRPLIWGQLEVIPEENLTVSSPDNMLDSKLAVFFVGFPIPIADWWESRYEVGGAIQYQQPVFEGVPFDQYSSFYRANMIQTFKLDADLSIELEGYLGSAYEYGLSESPLQGGLDLGIRKNFKNNSSLTLNWQDAFNLGSFWAFDYNRPELNLVFSQTYQTEGSIFRLTYAQSFGNTKLKQRERRDGASSDERNRVN